VYHNPIGTGCCKGHGAHIDQFLNGMRPEHFDELADGTRRKSNGVDGVHMGIIAHGCPTILTEAVCRIIESLLTLAAWLNMFPECARIDDCKGQR